MQLKENARVMLTYNVNVSDGLSNGTTGKIVGFIKNKKGDVSYVGVLFDDANLQHLLDDKSKASLKVAGRRSQTPNR